MNLGEFGKNVLVLSTGNLLAQAISLLIYPVITRVYSPEELGVFALFVAIYTFFSGLAAGSYEMSVISPEKDSDGLNLLVLACLVALCTSLFLLAVALLFAPAMEGWLNNPAIAAWFYAIPGMVLLTCTYAAFNNWNNRKKNFKRLAGIRVGRSLLTSGVKVGLGFSGFGSGGLILGNVAGQVLATGIIGWKLWREERKQLSSINRDTLRRQASRYVNFPKFMMASSLVASAAGHAPTMLIAAFFGSATLGCFFLSSRAVDMPLTLIGGSFREVFWQTANKEYLTRGNCRKVFLATFRKLLLLAILPTATILFFGPVLFEYVFGARWRMGGEFAQILSGMYFLRFVSFPFTSMFIIAEKQKVLLAFQMVSFFLVVGALVGVHLATGDPKMAIGAYAIVHSVRYILVFLLALRFSVAGPQGVHAE